MFVPNVVRNTIVPNDINIGGKGSATLSMAYAGARFGAAVLVWVSCSEHSNDKYVRGLPGE